jgi:D-amino-acid dehydrogenase
LTQQSRRPEPVIVLGGGVVGLCVALSLQERDAAVTLADAGDVRSQASWGNAGRIAVEQAEPLSSLATLRSLPGQLYSFGGPVALPPASIGAWLPFGLRFLAASAPHRFARGKQALGHLLAHALPAWRRRLAAIGAGHLLTEAGHYSIWESARTFAKARAAWARDAGAATMYEPDAVELTRVRALIGAPVAGALGFRGTASISEVPDLLAALRAAFLAKGGQWQQSTLRLDEAERAARTVIVAAGVGSAGLLRPAGHAVPLIAERGYHIHQPDTDWPDDMPPLQLEDRSLVVTRFRSGLRATSFVEFASQESPPDPRMWQRLRRHSRELGLPFDDKASEWMGSRPTLPDYLPAIGRSSRRASLYYAFGHQHLGLTLAAVTGEQVAALVCNEPPAIAVEAFSIDRFK